MLPFQYESARLESCPKLFKFSWRYREPLTSEKGTLIWYGFVVIIKDLKFLFSNPDNL